MLTATVTIVRFCTTCRGDVPFEQPGCLDFHGTDCPEWVCLECGEAVIVGFAVPEHVVLPRSTSHVA